MWDWIRGVASERCYKEDKHFSLTTHAFCANCVNSVVQLNDLLYYEFSLVKLIFFHVLLIDYLSYYRTLVNKSCVLK